MKFKLFLLIMLFSNNGCNAQDLPTLIYFGDPMCSWCYGFSPEISKAKKQLEGEVNFEMVMGGLRPYGTQTMAELDDFLKEHWHEVGERSGQPFQYDILDKKEFVYDTEPACRAVRTMRKLKPEAEFDFFKAVQTAFYFENKNTASAETYAKIAERFEVKPSAFQTAFESEEMKAATRKDFEKSGEMGVRGFPTVALKKGDEFYLICNGYATSAQVVARINEILK